MTMASGPIGLDGVGVDGLGHADADHRPCMTSAWPAEKPPPSGNIMMPAKPTRTTNIQVWPLPRIREVSAARWMFMTVV